MAIINILLFQCGDWFYTIDLSLKSVPELKRSTLVLPVPYIYGFKHVSNQMTLKSIKYFLVVNQKMYL